MKKLLSAVFLAVCVVVGAQLAGIGVREPPPVATSQPGVAHPARAESPVERAWQERRSNIQVRDEGSVSRMLADDNNGDRHQRFILTLASGHTVLIAHNIDLAPRIDSLRHGDHVAFFGEYEWNEQGGVIHWTHHDPAGRHPGGWLEHAGRRYE